MTALGELIAVHQPLAVTYMYEAGCACGEFIPDMVGLNGLSDAAFDADMIRQYAEHVADEIRKWRFQRPVITHANIDDIHDYCGEEDQEPA